MWLERRRGAVFHVPELLITLLRGVWPAILKDIFYHR
jgi:hypothetical protein